VLIKRGDAVRGGSKRNGPFAPAQAHRRRMRRNLAGADFRSELVVAITFEPGEKIGSGAVDAREARARVAAAWVLEMPGLGHVEDDGGGRGRLQGSEVGWR